MTFTDQQSCVLGVPEMRYRSEISQIGEIFNLLKGEINIYRTTPTMNNFALYEFQTK